MSRNPLSVIQGYCDFLLTETLDTDEIQDIIQTMGRSSVQMCNLVTDLLNVSQVNLGKFTLNKERVEIASYMQSIVKPNQLIAKRKKITLVLSPIDKKVFGYFDPHRICQVITNLLTNSIKFSHVETTTTISVEFDAETNLIFKVQDQGKGIKEEEIPYVFGEFQKTSTTSTAGEQSTGLGLAICRSIVLAHEGTINCESVIDEGSCFYFRIPNSELSTII
jgi:two-component system sensor histidine kinase/response regulator